MVTGHILVIFLKLAFCALKEVYCGTGKEMSLVLASGTQRLYKSWEEDDDGDGDCTGTE